MGRTRGRRRNNFTRLFKNTRGVSETVSILLTAIIVVAAGSTALVFGIGFLQQSTTAFRDIITQDTAKLQERFTVIDVWFNPSDPCGGCNVKVGIMNHGKAPFDINAVFLNGNLIKEFDPADEKFQPQEFRYVDLTSSQAPQAGEKFVVRVVTTSGTVHESTWKA